MTTVALDFDHRPSNARSFVSSKLPSWSLADRVAAALDRDRDGDGWAVIPIGAQMTGTNAREFTRALGMMVGHRFFERRLLGEMNSYRFNYFEARDGRLPQEIVGESATFKALHFDPHSEFFLHYYESSTNLLSGRVFLVDVRSYLQDTGANLRDVFQPRGVPHDPDRLVATSIHTEELLRSYSAQIEVFANAEPIILCVRNHWRSGVAHGVDHIRPRDRSKPWSREFTRVSLSPLH